MKIAALGAIGALIGLGLATVHAYIPAPQSPSVAGLIRGTVVDGLTGKPITGSIITLGVRSSAAARDGRTSANNFADLLSRGQPLTTAVSGADGSFQLATRGAGTYVISATARDYLAGGYGRTDGPGIPMDIELLPREELNGITLRLWRGALITGHVIDEANEPLIRFPVRAIRIDYAAGGQRLVPGPEALTDDRGEYRLVGLPPGSYLVAISTASSTFPVALLTRGDNSDPLSRPAVKWEAGDNGSTVRVGDFFIRQVALRSRGTVPAAISPNTDIQVYRTQFFSGSVTSQGATSLRLSAGEERPGIDFYLRPVRGVRVTGAAVSTSAFASLAGIDVRLTSALSEGFVVDGLQDAATSVTTADGRFTLLGVPAGEYVLRLLRPAITRVSAAPQSDSLWGSGHLSVRDIPMDRVEVSVQPSLSVGGEVAVQDSSVQLKELLRTVRIGLTPASGIAPTVTPPAGVIDDAGGFRSSGYLPGEYFVTVTGLPSGLALQSVGRNGVDVSCTPLVLEQADIMNLGVNLTGRPSSIVGTVTDAHGPMREGTVLLIPKDFPKRNGGMSLRQLRITPVINGRYGFPNVPSGVYILVAAVSVPSNRRDPDFLKSVAPFGTNLVVKDHDILQQMLNVSTSRR